MKSFQVEMVSVEELVSEEHVYRKYEGLIDFDEVTRPLRKLSNKGNAGGDGYGVGVFFRVLLLQFMEDLSDREMERFLCENTAAKWFCGFSLIEKTPDFSSLSKARKKIGASLLGDCFALVREQLRAKGYMNGVFTFVDASALISKAQLWEERDKARQLEYEKLDNTSLPKVSSDPQARIGSKGKGKFWCGYKEHKSVDMQSGLIDKVAVTPANVPDAVGFKHVAPRSGALIADKGYCIEPCQAEIRRRGLHSMAIKKNNMKDKNKDLDRWISGLRSEFERVFSKRQKRVRYKGIARNQFTAFMQAIAHNLKRLLVLTTTPLPT